MIFAEDFFSCFKSVSWKMDIYYKTPNMKPNIEKMKVEKLTTKYRKSLMPSLQNSIIIYFSCYLLGSQGHHKSPCFIRFDEAERSFLLVINLNAV